MTGLARPRDSAADADPPALEGINFLRSVPLYIKYCRKWKDRKVLFLKDHPYLKCFLKRDHEQKCPQPSVTPPSRLGLRTLRCWRVPRWPREACVSFNSGSISLHASTWRSSLVPHSETWWKLSCRMLTFVPLFYQEMVWFVPLFYQEVLCFCSSFISRDVLFWC